MDVFRNFSLLFISFSLLCSHSSLAQAHDSKTYKLYINLENAPFDSLYLQDYTEGRNLVIPGRKTKEFTWWIFRSIVRHDSDTKYASIPNQSTPRFRGKGYHLFRGKVHHFVKETVFV
jgi:hypothetical protein